jgi:hypothetical protein
MATQFRRLETARMIPLFRFSNLKAGALVVAVLGLLLSSFLLAQNGFHLSALQPWLSLTLLGALGLLTLSIFEKARVLNGLSRVFVFALTIIWLLFSIIVYPHLGLHHAMALDGFVANGYGMSWWSPLFAMIVYAAREIDGSHFFILLLQTLLWLSIFVEVLQYRPLKSWRSFALLLLASLLPIYPLLLLLPSRDTLFGLVSVLLFLRLLFVYQRRMGLNFSQYVFIFSSLIFTSEIRQDGRVYLLAVAAMMVLHLRRLRPVLVFVGVFSLVSALLLYNGHKLPDGGPFNNRYLTSSVLPVFNYFAVQRPDVFSQEDIQVIETLMSYRTLAETQYGLAVPVIKTFIHPHFTDENVARLLSLYFSLLYRHPLDSFSFLLKRYIASFSIGVESFMRKEVTLADSSSLSESESLEAFMQRLRERRIGLFDGWRFALADFYSDSFLDVATQTVWGNPFLILVLTLCSFLIFREAWSLIGLTVLFFGLLQPRIFFGAEGPYVDYHAALLLWAPFFLYFATQLDVRLWVAGALEALRRRVSLNGVFRYLRPFAVVGKKKRFVFFYVVVLSLVLVGALECGLRLAGATVYNPQDLKNNENRKANASLRVLTLGESTTADWQEAKGAVAWPRQLEDKLREKGIDARVFNVARVAVSTFTLKHELRENIEKFRPHLVISMMGVNDHPNILIKWPDDGSFWRNLRVVKLFFTFFGRSKIFPSSFQLNRNSELVEYWRLGQRREFFDLLEIQLAKLTNEIEKARYLAWLAREIRPRQTRDWSVYQDYINLLQRSLGYHFAVEAVTYQLANALFQFPKRPEAVSSCLELGQSVVEHEIELPEHVVNAFLGCAAKSPNPEKWQSVLAKMGQSVTIGQPPQNPTAVNYRDIASVLRGYGVPFFAMQYPLTSIEGIKNHFRLEPESDEIFEPYTGIRFLENDDNFSQALSQYGWDALFIDAFAGDFGHTTHLGHTLIAETALQAVIEYLEAHPVQ